MSKPYILVKYASRSRADRFLAGLQNIYDFTKDHEQIRVLVTADIDDKSMCNDTMRDVIEAYPNCKVIYGTSEGKIHAINRDMEILPDDFKDWSVVANFSDDMRWVFYGWEQIVLADFGQTFPDYDGFMAYLDPDTKGHLSTLYIAGRKFYDRFGFIYDPCFKSLFSDNIVEDCDRHLGLYAFENHQIYHHYNSSYGYQDFPADNMYLEQQQIGWSVDQKTYHEIIAGGIDNYLSQFKQQENDPHI